MMLRNAILSSLFSGGGSGGGGDQPTEWTTLATGTGGKTVQYKTQGNLMFFKADYDGSFTASDALWAALPKYVTEVVESNYLWESTDNCIFRLYTTGTPYITLDDMKNVSFSGIYNNAGVAIFVFVL